MDQREVQQEYTIKEAIESIDSFHNRAAIVVDNDEKVVGIISQGDVIRALISGKNIYSRVRSIIRPNYYYQKNKDLDSAYKLFKKHKITILPIVDDEYNLVDIIDMDDIYKYMEEKWKN